MDMQQPARQVERVSRKLDLVVLRLQSIQEHLQRIHDVIDHARPISQPPIAPRRGQER